MSKTIDFTKSHQVLLGSEEKKTKKRKTDHTSLLSLNHHEKKPNNMIQSLMENESKKFTMNIKIPRSFAKIFASIFEKKTSKIFSNMNMFFTENGLMIMSMSEVNQCGFYVEMKKEFFVEYYIKPESKFTITLLTSDLDGCCKSMEKYDNIYFIFEDTQKVQPYLRVKMFNTSMRGNTKMLERDSNLYGQVVEKFLTPSAFGNLEYDHEMELPSGEFHQIISDISRSCQHFFIATDHNKILFESVPTIETATATKLVLTPTDSEKNDNPVIFDKFMVQTLTKLIKLKIVSDRMFLHFKKNRPLYINYPFEGPEVNNANGKRQEIACIKFLITPVIIPDNEIETLTKHFTEILKK